MVSGNKKSGSFRKLNKKVPGNSNVTHFKKRKPKLGRCSNCGSTLHGVLRERADKMNKTAKTKKTPERPYGGNLCSKCSRNKIIEEARKSEKSE